MYQNLCSWTHFDILMHFSSFVRVNDTTSLEIDLFRNGAKLASSKQKLGWWRNSKCWRDAMAPHTNNRNCKLASGKWMCQKICMSFITWCRKNQRILDGWNMVFCKTCKKKWFWNHHDLVIVYVIINVNYNLKIITRF